MYAKNISLIYIPVSCPKTKEEYLFLQLREHYAKREQWRTNIERDRDSYINHLSAYLHECLP